MKSQMSVDKYSYIIRAFLSNACYRDIRISSEKKLSDLAEAILHAYALDTSACAYTFHIDKLISQSAEQITLNSLQLQTNQRFLFRCGSDDTWCFLCKVLQILQEPTQQTEVVRQRGKAPAGAASLDQNAQETPHPQIVMHTNQEAAPKKHSRMKKIDDAVLDAVFQYRSDRLWEQLSDQNIFAVQLSNGEIGYCSVTGELDEGIGLELFIGDTGLWSLYQLHRNQSQKPFSQLLSLNCFQMELTDSEELPKPLVNAVEAYAETHMIDLNERNSYPQFLKLESFFEPTHSLLKEELGYLKEALNAAHEVACKLRNSTKTKLSLTAMLRTIPLLTAVEGGYNWKLIRLPMEISFPYPAPKLPDDLTEKLRALPQRGTWESAVWIINARINDKYVRQKSFQPVLLTAGTLVKQQSTIIASSNYPAAAEQMLADLAQWLLTLRTLPKKIMVNDEMTSAFLQDLCEKCGITLLENDTLPKIAKLKTAYYLAHPIATEEDIFLRDLLVRSWEKLPHKLIRLMPLQYLDKLFEFSEQGLLPADLDEALHKQVRND